MDWDDRYSFYNAYPGHNCLLIIKEETVIIGNSRFNNIHESVIETSQTFGKKNIHVNGCTFEGFKQEEPLLGIIENCTFARLEDTLGDREFFVIGLHQEDLVFGRCGEFDNVETIVRNVSFKDICGTILIRYGKIEHCTFENCRMRLGVEGKGNGPDWNFSEAVDLTFVNCSIYANKRKYDFQEVPSFIQALSYLDKNKRCVKIVGCKFKGCDIPGGCKAVNTKHKILGAFGRPKDLDLGTEYDTQILNS